jgi:hypothetical protein
VYRAYSASNDILIWIYSIYCIKTTEYMCLLFLGYGITRQSWGGERGGGNDEAARASVDEEVNKTISDETSHQVDRELTERWS